MICDVNVMDANNVNAFLFVYFLCNFMKMMYAYGCMDANAHDMQ